MIPDVHKIRPHAGQGLVARRLRSLLHSQTYPSEIAREYNILSTAVHRAAYIVGFTGHAELIVDWRWRMR